MRQFLKYLLATLLGLVIFTLLGILIFAGIIGAASSKGDVTVADNSVLKIKLDEPIRERSRTNPFASLSGGDDANVMGLVEIKQALKKAKDDDNIKGVYIAAENPQAGWATLEEVRNALIDFKTSKKFVYSYAEAMTEKAYYIASVADKIYLNPAGDMEWNGISAELTFFKGSLDKLVSNVGYYDELEGEIRKQLKLEEKKKIEFVTEGKYKNAVSGDDSDDDEKVSSKNRIAVIVASGDINTGSGDDQSIGSDKIAGEIRKARLNDNIKAIVAHQLWWWQCAGVGCDVARSAADPEGETHCGFVL